MCLLDLPSASHFSPKASTLCVVALPQVATCPGPTSEPGAFSNCTLWPGGVIGPVNASARVATCPGPTSDPGAFSNCTLWPGGVIGPVNASARADTLPGTSARQEARSLATSKSIGTTSIPSTSGGPQIADRRAGVPPACPLNTVCSASCCRGAAAIDEEAKLEASGLTSPEIALEGSHQYELQI